MNEASTGPNNDNNNGGVGGMSSKNTTTKKNNNRNDVNRTSGGDLFADAQMEAKRELSEWIRSTLRQTFLEALPQTWTVEPENRVAISTEALNGCLQLVQQVSQKWQEHLKRAGHDLTATWVEEVFQGGKSTLWGEAIKVAEEEEEEESGEKVTNLNEQNNNRQEQAAEDSSPAHQDTENVDVTTNQHKKSVTPVREEEKHDNAEDPLGDGLEVPYTALRRLGKRTGGLGQPYLSSSEALQALEQMGESGASFWPLDWNLIDQVCSDIPGRFKAETGAGNLSYQVVPKASLTENNQANNNSLQQGDGDGDDDVAALNNDAIPITSSSSISPVTTVLYDLLERKRKKARPAANATHKRTRPSCEIASRPPSDVSMSTHHVKEELSKAEKEQLNAYLHVDEDEHNNAPMAVLLGPLDQVGATHNRLYKIDNPNEDDTSTEKEKRRRYRARIQERLDPRRVVKNKDLQRFPSRVLRTEDRYDDSKKFFDLDLGWSLMEMQSPTDEKKKRYCAFSSLEVVLEDKDPSQEQDTLQGDN